MKTQLNENKCLSCGAVVPVGRVLCDQCVETKVNPAALRIMEQIVEKSRIGK